MANTVAKIQAVLDLDTGKFSGSVTSAIGQVKAFSATVNSADKSIRNIERRVTGFGSSLRDSVIMLGQFRAAIQTVWMLTGEWVGSIIQANAKLERLQVLMKGLSKGATEAQRTADALKDMNFVLNQAKNAPFAVDEIANSFVKLKSSGIDPTKGAMSALIDAVAAFGGDDQTFHRATIAIQQMAGKGVISMEELRQQLGEAVPNAIQLMARSMNMTMAELVKAISLGRVEAKSALAKLFQEMQFQFGGSGKALMETWTGMVSKLKTEWLIFAKTIGDEGMFNGAKNALRDITNFLASADGKQFATDLGRGLGEAATAAGNLVHWLVTNRDEIITWAKLIAQIFVVAKVAQFSAALVSSLSTIGSVTTGVTAMARAFEAARAGTGAWSAVVAASAGPVGIAVAAIGGLILYLHNQASAASDAQRAMERYWQATANGRAVNPAEHAEMVQKVQDLKDLRTELEKAQLKLKSAGNNQYARESAKNTLATVLRQLRSMGALDDGGNALTDKFGMGASWEEAFEAISRATTGLGPKILEQNAIQDGDKADKILSKYGTDFPEMVAKVGGNIGRQLNEIADKVADGTMKMPEAAAARSKLITGKIDAQIAMVKDTMNRQQMLLTTVGNNQKARAAIIAQLEKDDEILLQLNEQRANVDKGVTLLPKSGNGQSGGNKANPLAEYLQQVIGKHAQLQAQLDGGIPNLEKFKALLAAGEFGKNPNGGMVGQIKMTLSAIDELDKKVKAQRATETLTNQLEDLAAKTESDVMVNKLQKTSQMYDQVSSSMATFRRQLAGYRNDLKKTNMDQKEFDEWVKKISKNLAEIDFDNLKAFVKNAEWEAYLDSLPKRARDLAEFTHRLQENNAMVKQMQDDVPDDPARQAEIARLGQRNADAIRLQYENTTKSSWQTLLEGWGDTTTQIDNAWADGMQSLNDHMTEFLTTGKTSWRDFATDIIKQIERILVSKALAALANFIIGLFGGGSYNSANYSDSGGLSGMGSFELPKNAKGNAFMGGAMLTKYANGGAFTNKLTSGTNVAPMAMFGEAGPEAIMPLSRDATGELGVKMHGDMSGGTQVNNNVSINVTINQDGSGGGTSSEDRSNTKDGQALAKLLDIRVRETMTAELRQGGILWRMQHGGV